MASSTDKNKSVVLRYVNEVQNAHDLDAIDDIFSPNYRHLAGTAAETTESREAIRPFYVDFLRAFPDLEAEVEHQIGEGNLVATFKTLRATHSGDFHGVAATGKRVEFNIADFFRVADGQLVDSYALLDEAGLLRQMGLDIPGWV